MTYVFHIIQKSSLTKNHRQSIISQIQEYPTIKRNAFKFSEQSCILNIRYIHITLSTLKIKNDVQRIYNNHCPHTKISTYYVLAIEKTGLLYAPLVNIMEIRTPATINIQFSIKELVIYDIYKNFLLCTCHM